MIERVFCFSKEIAKKNGVNLIENNFSMLLIAVLSPFAILFGVPFLLAGNGPINTPDVIKLYAIGMSIWCGYLVYFVMNISKVKDVKMQGFAKDNLGRIYVIKVDPRMGGATLAGYAIGGVTGYAMDGSQGRNTGAAIGTVIGMAADVNKLDKASKLLDKPENIAQMISNADYVIGAEIFEISNINSYMDSPKYIKLDCDCRNVVTNTRQYNKKIKIYKTYVALEDLVNTLLQKKV